MEQSNSSENKRVAKNTMVLYVRMIVMMIISFFTARITFNALGVTDYGINNVVGGLVSMFSLISSSWSASTSRFLTFGLGEGNREKLKNIFSTAVNIHALLAIIVLIVIESIGVWFLNYKMNIPIDRMAAANWVLQCSLVVFVIGIFSVPYNSAIIAHEKMTAFAYMTIFDAVTRLMIIGGVYFYKGDKLILFAVMLMGQSLIRQSIYWIYCKRKFEECTYQWVMDMVLSKKMFNFAGWSFIGCAAETMKDQGVNIAINIFTGPAINAARGIAMQVDSIIGTFTRGFMTALNPQIIKNYASCEYQRMYALIFQGTRLSYYLFMFFAIPIYFEIETVLQVWLGQIPEHTVLFTRLALIMTLIDILSNMLKTAQFATGKIRNYQIVVGGIMLLNFPISYYLLKIGFFPEITVIVAIVITQIGLFVRLCFLRYMIRLSIVDFLKKVYFNVLLVTIAASFPPAVCYYLIPQSFVRLLLLGVVSCFSSLFFIYYLGCDKFERMIAKRYTYKMIGKILKNI